MLNGYLIKAIEEGYHKDILWLRTILGIPVKSNKYFNVKTKEYILEESFKLPVPLIVADTMVEVPIEGKLKKIKGFKYIAYILFILEPFKGKIPYQEDSYTYNSIFKKYIVKDLLNEDKSDKLITIEDYKRFMKAIVFSHNIAPLIVHTETERTITAPPGIVEYKKKLIKEYKAKYGDDVLKDELKTLEIDEKLKAYDREYMKDDPTLGVVTNNKIMNVSRKSKFISIGKPTALIPTTETSYIEGSLTEGNKLDAKNIVDINNAIRYGSAARGMETQLTGLIAKYLSASTRAFRVTKDDCGVKKGFKVLITKDNITYINNIRYDIKGNIIKAKVGDTIEMRDYLYCKLEGNNFCKKCVGIIASKIYNPAILTAITTGGKGLSSSLSKFHAVVKDIKVLEKEDLLT